MNDKSKDDDLGTKESASTDESLDEESLSPGPLDVEHPPGAEDSSEDSLDTNVEAPLNEDPRDATSPLNEDSPDAQALLDEDSPETESSADEGTQERIKRKAPRVSVRRRVEGEFEDARVFGFTKDIGWGGMFLRTADVLEEDTEVDLRVQLQPDTPPVTVHGRVVRAVTDSPERGMAIAFHTEGKEPERQFIASFVREMELQLKLEKFEQAKRKFLGEVRGFQEDKVALERQRLAFADQEIKQSQDSHALREELRDLKRSYHEKLEQAEERRRQAETDLTRERHELRRERDAFERDKEDVAAVREQIDTDRERLSQEMEDLRLALETERGGILEDMDRERKLHKQLAARKASAREKEFERRLEQMQQRIVSLEHVNDLLESKCRDFETRTSAIRSQETGKTAAAEARLTEMEAEEAESAAQRRAAEARLEARFDLVQDRLRTAQRDLDNERRASSRLVDSLKDQLREANAQNQRLNDELDDLDETRAQLITDMDTSKDKRVDLETLAAKQQLELGEAKTRLRFRNNMFDELQERMQEHVAELEAERKNLQQSKTALEQIVLQLKQQLKQQPQAQSSLARPAETSSQSPPPLTPSPLPGMQFPVPAQAPRAPAPTQAPPRAQPPAPARVSPQVQSPVPTQAPPHAQTPAVSQAPPPAQPQGPTQPPSQTQAPSPGPNPDGNDEPTLASAVPDTADPDDLQHFGFGRRMSHWLEQIAVRVVPTSVDTDDIPNWEKDDGDRDEED
ncbi:PilZ domain-containing protein [Myxococcota bacterium]